MIGMHGSVCSQLSSQFTPLLKERMLGEKGVKVRSWSFHWPYRVTMWLNSLSLTTPASVVLKMLLDTCLTWEWKKNTVKLNVNNHLHVSTSIWGITRPTSGSMKLLIVLSPPFGWEIPSSYSAGSQRAKGVLEAPRRGFFLKSKQEMSIFGNTA